MPAWLSWIERQMTLEQWMVMILVYLNRRVRLAQWAISSKGCVDLFFLSVQQALPWVDRFLST